MRIVKPICKIAAFVLVFVLLNQLIGFFTLPKQTLSQEMWDSYRAYQAEGKNIDMVIVGDSHSYEAFDPDVIDPILGGHSYNMGTNSQSLRHSMRCIEDAIAEQDLKTAVLVLDPWNVIAGQERSYRAEATFVQGMNGGEPIGRKIRNTAEYLFDPDYFSGKQSLNYFFPWTWNKVHKNEFVENIKSKLTGKPIDDKFWTYHRKPNGFKGYSQVFDYDEQSQCPAEKWDPETVSELSMDELKQMCDLCRENGVQLIVVSSPQPRSVIIGSGQSYFQRNTFFREFFAKQNVPFYDFNLASAELYDTRPEYYKDWEHCNEKGAEAVSASLAQLVKMIRDGKDVSGLFYTDRKLYMSSFDDFDSFNCRYFSRPGQPIRFYTTPYKGLNAEIEFQLLAKGPGDEDYQVVREYSTERNFEWTPPKEGQYQLRVNARRVGSKKPYEHYRLHSRYWFAG